MSLVCSTMLLALLGPPPPRHPGRPEGGRRLSPEWLPGFLMIAIVLIMVVPMITIWSFHRPEAHARAACEASGGHTVFASVSGDGGLACRKR